MFDVFDTSSRFVLFLASRRFMFEFGTAKHTIEQPETKGMPPPPYARNYVNPA